VAAAGVVAMALTDHDTVAGVPEAVAEGERVGLRVICGCEFSVAAPWGEMHLLGYFLPIGNDEVESFLETCRINRLSRAGKIVAALQAWGVDVTVDEVVAEAAGGAIGRPHVARVLVRHGTVDSLDEAFNLYLGRGRPAYVGKVLPPLSEVADLVHRHGGLVSAAHLRDRATRATLQAFKMEGMDCLEVLHPSHSPDLKPRLGALAVRLGLLPTGGSDWHGGAGADHSRSSPGSEAVPLAWLEALDARREELASR
jgi:predicted metal-dependent phosphoesterase TrpH